MIPSVTRVFPRAGMLGKTLDIVITGSGFESGALLSIQGVTINSVTVDSAEQITANITVPDPNLGRRLIYFFHAVFYKRGVVVTNPISGASTVWRPGFLVYAPGYSVEVAQPETPE